MARRSNLKTKGRLKVGEVKTFLKEIFGEYIANIVIQETVGNKPDSHRLSQEEIRLLITSMDELFGCCGEVLYQLIKFEGELST